MLREGFGASCSWPEEFVLLLADTNNTEKVIIAEKIRRAVEELAISHKYSKVAPSTTVSMGMATYTETDQTAFHLLKIADEMLDKAKEQRCNRGGRGVIMDFFCCFVCCCK